MNLTHTRDATENIHASRWTLLFVGFHPDYWTCHEPTLGLTWTATHGLLKPMPLEYELGSTTVPATLD